MSEKPRKNRKVLLGVGGGAAALVSCICLVCIGVITFGMSTPTYKATTTAQAIADVTEASRPTKTDTPKSISTPTATAILPTATEAPTATSTPVPPLTPTSTQTPKPAQTPTPASTSTPTRTATLMPTPTKTLTPEPTNTPPPHWVPLLGKIWTGVKVYYGTGDTKAYGFEILGGSENCPSLPSGRGVKVLYPSGSKEWKDREYLVSSGLFYVLDNDPAISAIQWYEYDCP